MWLEGSEDYDLLLFGNHLTNRAVSSLLESIFNSELFARSWRGCLARIPFARALCPMWLVLALSETGSQRVIAGEGRRRKLTPLMLEFIKGGHQISDAIIESLVPKIHASNGGKFACVLALPFLWAAF